MILSDSTGVTAKTAVEKGSAQFNGCDDRFFTVPQQGDGDSNLESNDGDGDEACESMNTRIYLF
jgi:regulator of PEP synthase PpsR (kinase-PPPase family)